VAAIEDDLDAAYIRVRAAVGADVPVVVAPYLQPFADRARCDGVLFSRDERQFLGGFVGELNHVIANAATRRGFLYMDTLPMALRDHHVALCEGSGTTAGLNVVAPNPQGGTVADRLLPTNWTHNSIHPNSIGHAALADTAAQWFRSHSPLVAPAPQPSLPKQPVRSLKDLMDGRVVVQCGEGIECRVAGRHWLLAQVHDLYARAIVPVTIATIGLWLLVLSMAWITRRRNWGIGHLLGSLWRRTTWLRSRSACHRFVGFQVLLVVAVLAMLVLARVVAFPEGYGIAQKAGAAELATKDLLALLDGTTSDLAFYIPGYLLILFAVIMASSRQEPADRWRFRFVGGFLSDGTACIVAALVGVADVVETMCFRRAVERLQQGHAPGGVTSLTDTAAIAFWAKWSLAALLVVLIAARVRQPGSEPAPADENVADVAPAGPDAGPTPSPA
jgi:hypothetical protein